MTFPANYDEMFLKHYHKCSKIASSNKKKAASIFCQDTAFYKISAYLT